jgi:hypothetical protein
MATLHKEYNSFNSTIALNVNKKESLIKSRNGLKKKIKKYFEEEKKDEIQPKFWGQGSFEMNTTINPIKEVDELGNVLEKYDLDYGIYFIEKKDENNKRGINTWHEWVFNAVDGHTNTPPQKKNTCIRVIFADGHHIDLPIYYKNGDVPELAHKTKGWIFSDPKEFFDWFNEKAKADKQLRRIVRYLKAWKNYKENNNSSLKLPSGFALTILAAKNFVTNNNDDKAFKLTVEKIKKELDKKFECKRPTTPKDEDIFVDFSETKKQFFLNSLDSLINACQKAEDEKNFMMASEHLQKQFGERFPTGKDENEEDKSSRLSRTIATASIAPRPYARFKY